MQFLAVLAIALSAVANAAVISNTPTATAPTNTRVVATATQGVETPGSSGELPIACPTNAAGVSTGMTQCAGIGPSVVKTCPCGKCVYVNSFFSYCGY